MSHNSVAVQPFPSAGGLTRPGLKDRAPAAGRRTAASRAREAIPDCIPPAARARLGMRARRLLRADY
jgi:hypothetical protein